MSLGTLAVRHDPTSAAIVRRSIADDLATQAIDPSSIDDVVLVASELVGNAVVHTAANLDHELDVTWDISPDAVLVQVVDGSTDLPRPRSTSETQAGGRGLSIVASLALDWGVRRNRRGKQVWARVPILRR
jgi:anti-sigma regulatory factor (Ser/Thr protein kinase)